MSYIELKEEDGVQTLRLPSQYRMRVPLVSVEMSGECLIIRPASKKPSLEQLFSMIDKARAVEGDLVIDRGSNIPPQPKEYF